MKSLRPLNERRIITRRHAAILDAWMVSLEQRTLLSAILEPGPLGLAAAKPTPVAAAVAAPLDADTDDQISEAIDMGTIAPKRKIANGELDSVQDVDMYKFTITSGRDVSFDIDSTTTALSPPLTDSYVRVFDASGTELVANDDGRGAGEGWTYESFAQYTFPSAGTYYVGVSGYGNTGYNPTTGAGDVNGATGKYALTVENMAIDTDDQFTEAISLGPLTQPRSYGTFIGDGADVDMFSFVVLGASPTTPVLVSFDTDAYYTPGPTDTYLRLFDASGNQLAANDDGAAPDETHSVFSYLEYSFTSGAQYFIGVSGYPNTAYDPITGKNDQEAILGGYYGLDVNAIDTTDSDDQFSEARTLGTISPYDGQVRTDQIATVTDVDMFSFNVAAGETVGFDINPIGDPRFDSCLRLFDSSGNVLELSDNARGRDVHTPNSPYISYRFASGGTYYIAVSGSPNLSFNPITGLGDKLAKTGEYQFVVSGIPDDPDDQLSEAAALGTATSRLTSSGILSDGDDVDMYSFNVTAGQRLALGVYRDGQHTLYSALSLYDSSGNRLGIDASTTPPGALPGGSYLEYTFPSAGTYYVGVSGDGNDFYDVFEGDQDEFAYAPDYVFPQPYRFVVAPADTPGFQITLNLTGFTPVQAQIARAAAARWENVITTDLPGVDDPAIGRVDDLLVDLSLTKIDGRNGVTSQDGITHVRPDGPKLPYRAFAVLDSDDMAAMSDMDLGNTITHELGHLLGLNGSFFRDHNLIAQPTPFDFSWRFTGPQATAFYRGLFDVTASGVPLQGGTGTALNHWNEGILGNELMTPTINSGVLNPLSYITVAALKDIGYTVDLGAAEPYDTRTVVGGSPSGDTPAASAPLGPAPAPVTGAPILDSLVSSPLSTASAGTPITLTATAHDPDAGDRVYAVWFYDDTNHNGVAEASEAIGLDENPADGWNYVWQTKEHAAGSVTFLAVAEDLARNRSDARTLGFSLTPANNPPIVQDFSVDPSTAQVGGIVNLSAVVTNPDYNEPIVKVSFFDDANANGVADASEVLGTDTNESDGWSYAWTTTGHAPGNVQLLAVGYKVDGLVEVPSIPAAAAVVLTPPDTTAPQINQSALIIADGPHRLQVTFSENVSASLQNGDLKLRNTTTNTLIASALTSTTYDALNNTATWTFPGIAGGILPNGNYRVTFTAGDVLDAAGNVLDGNGDFIAGDDFVDNTPFVLGGDVNRDRAVSFPDLVTVAQHYGNAGSYAQGDLNGDGVVSFADLVLVAQNYGASLPIPASASVVSSPALASVVAKSTSLPDPSISSRPKAVSRPRTPKVPATKSDPQAVVTPSIPSNQSPFGTTRIRRRIRDVF